MKHKSKQCKCNEAVSETIYGHFNDSVTINLETGKVVSVRDGVLEYLGAEIGMEPADQVFAVYRSPAEIANAARLMDGIPLTNGHVTLDTDVESPIGSVLDSLMIDHVDESTSSHVAVQNGIKYADSGAKQIAQSNKEASLGYKAELIPHHIYDFEQKNLMPHHLASVPAGRCGSACSFIDRKPTHEVTTVKTKQTKAAKAVAAELHGAFLDADGQPSLEQVVEIAQKLPDALKRFPMDKLQEIMPTLEEIVAFAADAGVEMPAVEDEESEAMDEDKDNYDADKDKAVNLEDSAQFKDAVKKATDAAISRHSEVVAKAVDFVDESYDFAGKGTAQVMRDALATQYGSQKFEDSELATAFKMLKPVASNLKTFGDNAAVSDRFADIADKEL